MFKTIRQVAKEFDLSETMLRTRLANKRLPGFYSGNRFLVDVDLLLKLLREESAKSISGNEQAV